MAENPSPESTPAEAVPVPAVPVVVERTVVVRGIVLPWEYRNAHAVRFPEDYPDGDGYQSGEVFVPMETLDELDEQGRYDSMFGSSFGLDWHAGLALAAVGFAEEETRGGFHGTPALREWLVSLSR